jgi:hypothetical protein
MGEIELREWFGLARQWRGEASQTLGSADALRSAGQSSQLDQWVEMIEGRDHGLPGFAEALAVQETVEALLARQA